MENSTLQGRTVLIVDDDPNIRYMTRLLLESKGVGVYEATNGQEGIEILEENPKSIDIVLMDMMMPVMDGLTAIRQLRQKPEFTRIPIIALTAKTQKSDRDECMDAGASDYLTKPVASEKLFKSIEAWIWSLSQDV